MLLAMGIAGASLTAGVFVIQVAVLPLVFKYSKVVQRRIVFANYMNWPKNCDYENPKSCNIIGCRNLNIEFKSKVDDCDVKIGVWHVLPKSVYKRLQPELLALTEDDKEYLHKRMDEELANSEYPVVLYCHGNSNHRASPYRIDMYLMLQQMNFHVVTFDYRGYGDSTKVHPSEDGVVEDSLVVYAWLHDILSRAKERPALFVWGHSLGTAVAAHLLGNLEDLCTKLLERESLPLPSGLILEAPFNNLRDEVAQHPLSRLVKWLPYYEESFLKPFTEQDHAFKTDEHLARVRTVPILMLHSKVDCIVPHDLAVKLYESVKGSRAGGGAEVKFHSYEKCEGLGHNNICTANDLPAVVREFVAEHS